jgi:uncharacterized protein (DUF934 family)
LRVIKDKRVVDDSWQWIQEVSAGQSLPEGNVIIPFTYWQANREALLERAGQLGVCINGDDDTDEVAEDLPCFDLLAIEFPAFKDGRGYSHARILRDHYHYQGDIRALGDVLRDQLFYMQRCGITSFCVREDTNIEEAIKGLTDFSVKYQTAADGAQPVYKQR